MLIRQNRHRMTMRPAYHAVICTSIGAKALHTRLSTPFWSLWRLQNRGDWLLIVLIAGPAQAMSGRVIGVSDGDTLTVLVDRKPVKVRLAEIDAPERKQPYGTRSRQSLAELCHRKQATVVERDKDRYGRTVGYVSCAGVEANAEQVRRGMAWVFDRYAKRDSSGLKLKRKV